MLTQQLSLCKVTSNPSTCLQPIEQNPQILTRMITVSKRHQVLSVFLSWHNPQSFIQLHVPTMDLSSNQQSHLNEAKQFKLQFSYELIFYYCLKIRESPKTRGKKHILCFQISKKHFKKCKKNAVKYFSFITYPSTSNLAKIKLPLKVIFSSERYGFNVDDRVKLLSRV